METYVNICDLSDKIPLPGINYEEFLATGSSEEVFCAVEDEYETATGKIHKYKLREREWEDHARMVN